MDAVEVIVNEVHRERGLSPPESATQIHRTLPKINYLAAHFWVLRYNEPFEGNVRPVASTLGRK